MLPLLLPVTIARPPSSAARCRRAALATPDKEFVSIPGATHYYLGQPDLLATCIATVTDWSRRKGLLEG